MKVISNILKNFLFLSLLVHLIKSDSIPFQPVDHQSLNRMSESILSPDGKYAVFTIRKWSEETGKSSTNIQYIELKTKTVGSITPVVEDQTDSNPTFSKAFPDYIFFQRNNQLRYIKFRPNKNDKNLNEDESVELTNYLLKISSFKLKNNAFVFVTDVYFDCKDMNCTKQKIEEENTHSWRVYNSLHMFHWDQWLNEGKGSHIFYQKFSFDEASGKFELIGEARDLTLGMNLNTPPLFSDNYYDISNNGELVAFSAHIRNHEESWSTSWKTYYFDTNFMDKPLLITNHTNARTQDPKFSFDDTKIAYLAMKTPMLESENLHFEIYNILTNKISVTPDTLDISVNDYSWESDNVLNFQATNIGLNKIYKVDISDVDNPSYTIYDTKTITCSFGLPFRAIKNRKVVLAKKVGYARPDVLVTFPDDKLIYDPNEDILKAHEFPEPELFSFIGGYNDTVYGWMIKPINFNASKAYPSVLLIHGGPESSWTSGWNYGWNPTMYAQQGYVVIMINIHGSTGVSSKFRDAVRNDWGGVPYEDLITGIRYALTNFKFLDMDKICAIGGSYGGYMINWINGHNNLFRCLVNHDGAFSSISKFYSTDELWFPKAEFCPKEKIGCNPFDGKEIREGYEKNSPERWVHFWSTPTLVIHGGKDYRVPLTEGLQAFTSLQLRNVESQFLYFPLEIHCILRPENQIEWFNHVFAWLEKYLKYDDKNNLKY